MCHELDSQPPIAAIAGAAIAHEDLLLEASDGNRLAAFLAAPEEPDVRRSPSGKSKEGSGERWLSPHRALPPAIALSS